MKVLPVMSAAVLGVTLLSTTANADNNPTATYSVYADAPEYISSTRHRRKLHKTKKIKSNSEIIVIKKHKNNPDNARNIRHSKELYRTKCNTSNNHNCTGCGNCSN